MTSRNLDFIFSGKNFMTYVHLYNSTVETDDHFILGVHFTVHVGTKCDFGCCPLSTGLIVSCSGLTAGVLQNLSTVCFACNTAEDMIMALLLNWIYHLHSLPLPSSHPYNWHV